MRAEEKRARPRDAGPREVAAFHGVVLEPVEDEGRTRLCYDGEAFRRVLAQDLGGGGRERARAVLALKACPAIGPPQAGA